MTNQPKPVHEALADVMRSVGAVGKAGKNTQQNYSFRKADDVVAAVGAALREHGVLIIPEVVDQQFTTVTTSKGAVMQMVRLFVRYRAVGPAGDSLMIGPVWGESMDIGDKAANKALTAAQKYALCEALMIPTHDADADEFSPGHTPAANTSSAEMDLDADARANGYKDEVHRAEQHHFAATKYKAIPAEYETGRQEAKAFKSKHGPVFTYDKIKEWLSIIESATSGALEPVPAGYAMDADQLAKLGEDPF